MTPIDYTETPFARLPRLHHRPDAEGPSSAPFGRRSLVGMMGVMMSGFGGVPMVTNGLVFNLDAINNTGSGHDSSATEWRDSVSSFDVDVNGLSWTDNGLSNATTSAVSLKFRPPSVASSAFASGYTMCFVGYFDTYARGNDVILAKIDGDESTSKCYHNLSFAHRSLASVLASSSYQAQGGSYATDIQIGGQSKKFVAINGYSGYQNCGMLHSVNTGNTVAGTNNAFERSPKIATQDMILLIPQMAQINAVAVYNRTLTLAEMEQNRAFWCNRFFAG